MNDDQITPEHRAALEGLRDKLDLNAKNERAERLRQEWGRGPAHYFPHIPRKAQ